MSSATHPTHPAPPATTPSGEPALVVTCGAHGKNARAVRDLVSVAAELAGAGDTATDDLRSAVGELFANCVTHLPGTTVHVEARHDRSTRRFTVHVDDHDDTRVLFPHEGPAPATEAESGYGLHLVHHLTDRCGVIPLPAGRGKRVWFTISI
ncbi:ATP-binding protein [Streptomyces sp. SID3343]|uniref:ATP-binding protein n=1 Tax=Streptomyces sp. SID3343 TaxID=2690260 RepID=UPI0013718DF1|nr:ATP-binding protein [Streptomyces sp. SID3343]MYW05397.1 hypothetical protein [Streptomyces sp. SID3343]